MNAPATVSVQRKVVERAKSGRCTENESYTADIVDHRRLMRLIHLAPQPSHVNVNEVGLRHELVVPHLFEQHGTRQHLLLSTHHVFEQPEFARQKVNPAVAALGDALDEIKLERSYPQHCIPAFC